MSAVRRFCSYVQAAVLVCRIKRTVHNMRNQLSESDEEIQSEQLDKNVDKILEFIEKELKLLTAKKMDLPNLREMINYKLIFGMELKGEFLAWNGWFKDITSIYRISECRMEKTENGHVIYIFLSLRTMEFGFDNYEIDLSVLSSKGKFGIIIEKNLLRIGILLPEKGSKNTNLILQTLSIDQLEGFKIFVTGFGKFGNKIAKKIIGWTIESMKNEIKENIEQEIKICLDEIISKYNII